MENGWLDGWTDRGKVNGDIPMSADEQKRRRQQKQGEEKRTSRKDHKLPNNPEELAPFRFPAAAAWTAFAFVD